MEDIEVKDADAKTEDKVELKAKMTLLNGVTVIVGSIIGSGIFVSPSGVLANTGSVNMSLTVSELGCVIKKTGAPLSGQNFF